MTENRNAQVLLVAESILANFGELFTETASALPENVRNEFDAHVTRLANEGTAALAEAAPAKALIHLMHGAQAARVFEIAHLVLVEFADAATQIVPHLPESNRAAFGDRVARLVMDATTALRDAAEAWTAVAT